jgi:hypothetical protein
MDLKRRGWLNILTPIIANACTRYLTIKVILVSNGVRAPQGLISLTYPNPRNRLGIAAFLKSVHGAPRLKEEE